MKLNDIPTVPEPKQAATQVDTTTVISTTEPISEDAAIMGDDEPNIYGLDPSDPEYATRLARLKALKREDPELFQRIGRLD
jgi:hypothetical protein